MANRICLGQRDVGEFGLWVSKPGVNVLTATDAQLLMGTDLDAVQIVARGAVSMAAGVYSVTQTIVDAGGKAALLWRNIPGSGLAAAFAVIESGRYASNTSLVWTRSTNTYTQQNATSLRWIMLNQNVS